MGITIENADALPAILYDHIHLEELIIKQQLLKTESQQPKFELIVNYRPYGLDEDGNKYYAKKPIYINIEDYLLQAQIEAAQGNTVLLQAFGAIQQALADIIANTGRHGSTEVY